MKSRNREVNIFNMSLLDVLCGALGAFCFISLTLFPYYGKEGKDPGSVSAEQFQELQKKLDEALKAAAKGDTSGAVEKLRQQLEQYQQQLQQEEQARQQADAARRQADAARQQAEQNLQQAQKKLQAVNPVSVQILFQGAAQDVDLFIRMPSYKDGKLVPGPEPVGDKKQGTYYGGDAADDCKGGTCMENWLMRDMPPGLTAEIYYKLTDLMKDPAGTSRVSGNVLTSTGQFIPLPETNLNASRRVVLVGKLTVQPDRSLKFESAISDSNSGGPPGSPNHGRKKQLEDILKQREQKK
jgi:hypothetical protein